MSAYGIDGMNVYDSTILTISWFFFNCSFKISRRWLADSMLSLILQCMQQEIWKLELVTIRLCKMSLHLESGRYTQNPLKILVIDEHLNQSLKWLTLSCLWKPIQFLPKSLFFKCTMCRGKRVTLQLSNNHIICRMFVKDLHHTFLLLWSVHVCAVLPGCHWSLLCIAWNNRKLLTQASLLMKHLD